MDLFTEPYLLVIPPERDSIYGSRSFHSGIRPTQSSRESSRSISSCILDFFMYYDAAFGKFCEYR